MDGKSPEHLSRIPELLVSDEAGVMVGAEEVVVPLFLCCILLEGEK